MERRPSHPVTLLSSSACISVRQLRSMASVTESKVLVIYTGGTIGMLSLAGRGDRPQGGLAPEPFFLTETLRSQSRFHDPFEDSLFSHSSSVEGFRKWNYEQGSSSPSGRSSPQPTPTNTTAGTPNPGLEPTVHRSTVRSSRPIIHPIYPSNSPAPFLNDGPMSSNNKQSPYYETQLPTLVTPRTQSPYGFMRRIRYAILEASNTRSILWIPIN